MSPPHPARSLGSLILLHLRSDPTDKCPGKGGLSFVSDGNSLSPHHSDGNSQCTGFHSALLPRHSPRQPLSSAPGRPLSLWESMSSSCPGLGGAVFRRKPFPIQL